MGWLFKQPPSSGAARHLLPDGEKNGPARAGTPVPRPIGERVDRPQAETGEGAFSEQNCAIWNDIARALGAKSEQSK